LAPVSAGTDPTIGLVLIPPVRRSLTRLAAWCTANFLSSGPSSAGAEDSLSSGNGGGPKSPERLAWPDARLPPETERAVPRDSTGKLATRSVTRPFGAAAALVLAIVVSLFGTSLSVGRQPVPIGPIDPSAFTAIVPPAASGPAPTEAPPGIFTDFRNQAAGLSRVAASVPLPRRQFVRKHSNVVAAVTTTVGNTHRVKGVATWYCLPGVSSCTSGYRGGLYAAAGSELRIGNWRGRHVKVCSNGNCVVVTLIDWCACGGSRIIDLYHDAFSRLASPSVGGIGVTVTW
jgi:hypothetical protein